MTKKRKNAPVSVVADTGDLMAHVGTLRDDDYFAHMRVTGMPGCCTLSVVHELWTLTPGKLVEAEAQARFWKQHCVIATISTNQKEQGADSVFAEAGWTHVHTFKSKPYGGGEVFVWVKNLI